MRVSFDWLLLYQNFIFGDLHFPYLPTESVYITAFHMRLLEYLLDSLSFVSCFPFLFARFTIRFTVASLSII